MSRVVLQPVGGPGVDELPLEIVERKGLGHPDSICDAVVEQVSLELSRAYREHFGQILHHNCDKALLVAGRAEPRFGGGRVLEPMTLYIGDRASDRLGHRRIDVAEIARGAANEWMREHLPRIDPGQHLRISVELRPGSSMLSGLFKPGTGRVLAANDTSAGVGYAPLSETEQIVLACEQTLNGSDFGRRFPWAGEDVKVMGLRLGRRLELTVAVPLIDRDIRDERNYFEAKQELATALHEALSPRLQRIDELELSLNALDRRGRGADGVYLSVTGTSAESADSGQVGRGNRVNGLIAFMRPQSLEAAAGKNPTSHVGKIYNLFAQHLARQLHAEVPGVHEAQVWLLSRIGQPVDQPHALALALRPEDGASIEDLEPAARSLVELELADMASFCEALSVGRWPVV